MRIAQQKARALGLSALAATALALAPAATAATTDGTVEAAGKPISGASIELRQAGTTGSRSLGEAKAAKDGTFALDYMPDASGGPLYVLASGRRAGRGKPGSRVRLMSVLGRPTAPPSTVFLTEQTTVASAYSLARFLHGRSVSGPEPGLSNAADTAANLMEARTGKVSFVLASAPNGNATETLPKFNTLANALASCTRGTGRDCAHLFAAARIPGERRPRNTLAAAQDLALFPGQAAAAIFAKQSKVRFAPALEEPPNDWTLALVFVGSGLNAPGRMAFDAEGNVWTVNNFESPGTTPGRNLTVLSPTGVPILGSPITGGGLSGAGWGVAIDQARHVWVANYAGSSISEFGPDGTVLSPSNGFADLGLTHPQGLAVDQGGNLWNANFGGDSVVVIRDGDTAHPQTIDGGGISNPFSIAIDEGGDAWVTNGADSGQRGAVVRIANDGTVVDRITGGGLLSPQGISEDFDGNFWVSNLLSDSVTRIKRNGKVAKGSPIRVHSLGGPWGNAVDGDGKIWVAGFSTPALTQLCGARTKLCPGKRGLGDPISPARHGYVNEGLQHVTAVQVDPSGNVWAANNWTTGSSLKDFVGGNGLVEFVGAAAPVAAPLIGPPRRP